MLRTWREFLQLVVRPAVHANPLLHLALTTPVPDITEAWQGQGLRQAGPLFIAREFLRPSAVTLVQRPDAAY